MFYFLSIGNFENDFKQKELEGLPSDFIESIDLSRNCLVDTFHKSCRRKGKPFSRGFLLFQRQRSKIETGRLL